MRRLRVSLIVFVIIVNEYDDPVPQAVLPSTQLMQTFQAMSPASVWILYFVIRSGELTL